MLGLIVKGIAGFYYVRYERLVFQCKARGIFKKDGVTPTVGDYVEFEALDDEEGVINSILPRQNHFIRPPIANVDCFFIVLAAAQPEPNLFILDKFLVNSESAETPVVICINKTDLSTEEKLRSIESIYEGIYPVLRLSCVTGEGLDLLPGYIEGKKIALAGPSGVGKTTMINRLRTGANLETGSVSDKTKRGRHVTRHVELYETDCGGMIFDTPGFTSFDAYGAEAGELADYFPEMADYTGKCKFDDCLHLKEPGCAVRDAVQNRNIAESRYESYVRQLTEGS
jgi:ribosome biogenesis GTPase